MLIWRTASTMLNGAVIGLAPATRIVLLTDALLERLPLRQVEGVMAHELGHVRRRHMIWLGVAMLGSIGITAALGELALRWAGLLSVRPGEPPPPTDLLALGLSAVCLLVGVVFFGFVSRRFEWQADAFAVQALSRTAPDGDPAPGPSDREGVATAEAVDSAAAMLAAVARINHIRPEQFSWRHGSIATRIGRIEALRGLPLDRFPIDRQVRWVKIACAAAAAAAIALAAWPPL
ncbi:MAG: M48 family metalloprotease [Phycisphaerae bacterium]|nr:M48 family metalloprotease [Phycisphaerae bacterium]